MPSFRKICYLAALASCAFLSQPLLADCGKIMIVVWVDVMPNWIQNNENIVPPAPPVPNPPKPVGWEEDIGPTDQVTDTTLPEPVDLALAESSIGDGAGTLGLFEEPKQLGFIAWNGSREILAIRTDEKAEAKGAYLSILPLPGPPIDVRAGKNTMWNRAENVFKTAFATAGVKDMGAGNLGVVLEKKIGSHEIFVWKIDSFDGFVEKIQYYINTKYKGKAIPLIPKDTKRVLEDYVQKKGYRYFAFDLLVETGSTQTKQTILYEFETPKQELYYPLVISQSGGVGTTAIEILIVCDKENLTYASPSARTVVAEKFKNRFEGTAKAHLTRDQLKTIDSQFTKLFDNDSHLYARWYTTKSTTDIRSFIDDFRLTPK